jgi:hypothetical protein
MSIDEVIEFVEQILEPKQLDPIKQFVLKQSWLGQTYSEMTQSSGYCCDYIEEVGYKLWQELSETLGQRVTKKNLHLVLKQHQQDPKDIEKNRERQELPRDIEAGVSLSQDREIELEFPSGPLSLGSPLYINRPPIEKLAYAEISRPGCLIRIKAPMKMGKSSLLNQIIAHAAQKRYKTVYIDFQEAEAAVFTCLNKFLRWLCANISRQLDLIPKLDDYWDEDMGSKVSCKIYLEAYLLEQIDSPLVLSLNEVNRVFEYPNIARDFLSMLRSWYERARQVEAWQKLRLVIVYTTDVYIPLKLNQSPFNIGLLIGLPQFSLEQVQDLAHCYGLDWRDDRIGKQHAVSLMAMVGGHPYLVSLALYYLCRREMSLEELLQAAPTTAGIYSHYLRSHLTVIREHPQLAAALQQVVSAASSVQLDAIATYKLESMGLIKLDGNWASPSCLLYRLYFRAQLGVENWIDAASEQL